MDYQGPLKTSRSRLFPKLVLFGGLAVFLQSGVGVRASSMLSMSVKGGAENLQRFTAEFTGLDSAPTTYYAGTFTASLNGGPSFDSYCVDLYHTDFVSGTSGPSYLVNPVPIADLTSGSGGNGSGVGYLYDQFAPVVAAMSPGQAQNIDGAALQVAIWKVEYDNGGPLTTGNFTVRDSSNPSSVQHQIFQEATYFLSFYNGTQSGDALWLAALTHPLSKSGVPINQDLIGPVDPGSQAQLPPLAAPEPATIISGALGALGLLAYRWRVRRRRPEA